MVEFVYRSHAAELLDRLAAGGDTRPPTAAELCLACCEISQQLPLHGPAAGEYLRQWLRAFPGRPLTADHADQVRAYEQLYDRQLDDVEADLARRLTAVACSGRHHGRPLACRYTTPAPPPDTSRRRQAGAR